MAEARLAILAIAACALLQGCGTSPCGLGLKEHLFLPPAARAGGQQRNIELPCCGGSVFRDLDLSSADVEIDLTNPNASGVDGFVTAAGCDKLFEGPYTGSAASPLCQVYIGPVRPQATSERKKLARGRYRIFAQGYSTNDAPVMISLDLGVWSTACRWNPIGP